MKSIDIIHYTAKAVRKNLIQDNQKIDVLIKEATEVVYVASGSTALGIASATKDFSEKTTHVIQNINEFEKIIAKKNQKILVFGVSMSGLSTEVGEILRLASSKALNTIYVTKALPIENVTTNIILDFEEIPIRFLPFAICLLVHHYHRSGFDEQIIDKIQFPLKSQFDELLFFLEFTHKSELTPIFVTSDYPFWGYLLSTQYIEFLKKAAFHLSFPEWTHNYLWVLEKRHKNCVSFIHMKPQVDLKDDRFKNVVAHIKSLQIHQLIIGNLPIFCDKYQSSSQLLQVLVLYWELSRKIGIDPNIERSFNFNLQ